MDYLKKEKKWESYVYVIISIIIIILGILILVGYLEISEGAELIYENKTAFAWILVVGGLISTIYGSYHIVKLNKLKKSSFYTIKKYNDEDVKARLEILGADFISIDKQNFYYSIELDFEKADYCCDISEDNVLISIDCKEWYFDTLTDEEKEAIDDLGIELDPLKVSFDDILKEFINFVLNNRI